MGGIGHRDGQGNTNFLVVDSKTRRSDIEDKFNELISRSDIGVIIIAQHTADSIRHALNAYTETGQVIPTILEAPTKDHPINDDILGEILIILVLNVAAAEVAIGLALLILYYRIRGSIASRHIYLLKG